VSSLTSEALALSDDALSVAGEVQGILDGDLDTGRLSDLLDLWVAIGRRQDECAAALFDARWVR
jgi:hypothetical protein